MGTKHSIELLVEEEQQKFLTCLSHQRHDWLNHFQVLLGYLKLQRYDFCEEYIKKVTDHTNNESRIASLGIRPLTAYLLTYNALYRDVRLEVEVPEIVSLTPFSKEVQERVYKLIVGIVEGYRHHSLPNDGQPNVLVILIKKLENTLYISVEYEGSLQDRESLHTLYALVEELGNEEGFFVEGLHNNHESMMEFYVPLSLEAEVKG